MPSSSYYNHSFIATGNTSQAMWKRKAAQWLREAITEDDITPDIYVDVLMKYCKSLEAHEIDKQSTLPLFKFLQLIDTQLDHVFNVTTYDYANMLPHLHVLITRTLEANPELLLTVLKEHGWDPVPLLSAAIKYDRKVAVCSHQAELDFEETLHFYMLQRCQDALLTHQWKPPQHSPSLDYIWETEFIEGTSGSAHTQLKEEYRIKKLIECLPNSFSIWVNGAYKSFYTEWTPQMLLDFANMDMSQTSLIDQLPFLVRCMQDAQSEKQELAWAYLKTKYPTLTSALETWSNIASDLSSKPAQEEFVSLWRMNAQNESLDSKIQLPELH